MRTHLSLGQLTLIVTRWQRNLDELKKDEAGATCDLNYDEVGALSDEDREHLKAHRPASIGHARCVALRMFNYALLRLFIAVGHPEVSTPFTQHCSD